MPIDPTPLRPPFDPNSTPGASLQGGPGASFVNTLLGADLDGQGISHEELQAALRKLGRLSQDGVGNDAAEKALLAEIKLARSQPRLPALEYEVRDDALVFHIHRPGGTTTTSTFGRTNTAPDGDVAIGGARVIHGDDPGDFYCEHIFFSAQLAASAPDCSIVSNGHDERLVGFLHWPTDPWADQAGQAAPQEVRHQQSRKVLGAALRGYFDAIVSTRPRGTPHVLLTGYDQFGWVKNNPTGDFVIHTENLDAAMKAAFGVALVNAEGKLVGGDGIEGPRTYEYTVKDPINQRPRKLRVSTARFLVEDRAIDPDGARSIQSMIKSLRPHGVISMGIAGGQVFKAEHRADAGGMRRTATDHLHDDAAGPGVRLVDNYALARAIKIGAAAMG